ncbi:ATP-binding protein [uncultured Clostridium sp.]|uniref:ATP-binding protein n=1 Tax=uncultured Clostridium sp. TaxID=59620 RepID=UPI00261F774B|nr:ATP-binding protein [uncultured Clostridium sp.]
MKCKRCGVEYKLNENIADFLPEKLKEKLKYIPNCDCLEKDSKYELEIMDKKLEAERRVNRIKRFRDVSIVDSKFNKSFFKYAEENKAINMCKKYTDKFIEKTPKVGMYLYGPVGTGKTFAACCMANELMESNKATLVMNLGLYLTKLKREWAEAENDVLNHAKECDMLIIDDFGVEKVTEFVLEKLFALIDTRYRSQKAIIITSNLSLEETRTKFGDRIADRIVDMCFPIEVKGESMRGKKTTDEFVHLMM